MSHFFGGILLNDSLNTETIASQMNESMAYFGGDGTGVYETLKFMYAVKFKTHSDFD